MMKVNGVKCGKYELKFWKYTLIQINSTALKTSSVHVN